MRSIPDGILNPGVKVALDGEQALGGIKYDPALHASCRRARAQCSIESSAIERMRRSDSISSTPRPNSDWADAARERALSRAAPSR